MIRFRLLFVPLALGALAWAHPARAEWLVVPPRAGQVGLSVQGQYGLLLKQGDIGNLFDQGPGLAVRMRYRMRYERAMGLSFESQRFDVRTRQAAPPSGADTTAKFMSAFCYGVDVYQMFSTRTRTTKWVGIGAGLAQFRRHLQDTEIDFSNNGDGLYVSAGAGVERFVWQSWALDLSGKYLTVFQNGSANHDFQAALGVVVYATY